MRAITYHDYGDSSVYHFEEVPTPSPAKGQLLVRVRATSVNPVDWKMRNGELKLATAFHFPIIPGRDLAGEVTAVGEGVSKFKVGDRVFGMVEALGGTYAEFALIGEGVAAAMPSNLSFEEAASVPLVALTALQALRDHGDLVAGERVVVNGASGGVGTMAVQIARALGASEIVGVCGKAHVELVRSLGVDRVIDHAQADVTAARDAYDVFFDAVGKLSYADAKPALRHDGRYVTTLPDPAHLLGAAMTIFTEKKMRTFMAKDRGEDLALIRGWLESGAVKPVIDKTFPFDQAIEATRYSEGGHPAGKVVIAMA